MSNVTEVKTLLEQSDSLLLQSQELWAADGGADQENHKRARALMEEAKDLRLLAEQKQGILDVASMRAELQKNSGGQIEYTDDGQEPDVQVQARKVRKDKTEWKNWEEWIKAVSISGHRDISRRYTDARLVYFSDKDGEIYNNKQMSGATGAAGGYLIPSEFDAQLRAAIGELGIIRPRATVIRIRGRRVELPLLDQSAGATGVPAWFGGMQFYWIGETEEKTATEPTFEQLILAVNKLVGYTETSDELLSDSAVSLADFLGSRVGFAGGIAFMEDYYFFNGNGTGQPIGVLDVGNTALVTVARATAAQVNYPDLVGMVASKLASATNPVWVINQSAMTQMLLLEGPSGNPAYLWGSAVTGAPSTLLGYPVVWSEKTPALGTEGDVLLADFGFYCIGDRQATTIESSPFPKWKYDITSWRAVHRVDGKPWIKSPITLIDGSTIVSPFVALTDVAV